MTRLTIITLLLILPAIKPFAQSSARASVSVTIMEPVGAQKLNDLNFGQFAMDAKPGTIALRSSGSRSISGGVKLDATADGGVALLHVINNNQAYSVTLPPAITVMKKDNRETMTVGSFTLDTKEDKNRATQSLAIGATLYAGAFQAAGEYIELAPLTVTVNYN